MTSKLPTKLNKGPLVDAAFEIRFDGTIPLSTVLPGYLYASLKGESIERLPQADIPQQVRDFDPNFQFTPLIKIRVGQFYIAVSDRSLQVSCKHPYAGWAPFKEQILKTLEATNSINLVGKVSRFSLKYTDVLPNELMHNPSDYLNASFRIGDRAIDITKTIIQAEILEDEAINLLHIAGKVQVNIVDTGEVRSGLLVDIDSIRQIAQVTLGDFISTAGEHLDALHALNKKIFFDCLSERGLASLEPVYA
ncbi:hypothetical protein BK672_02280 [Pseudomonas fluorescens]|uniref:TIGR04255 family protein n=1 Tax=Pseudomonas fluorescens TaxID=294 RepID=A0A423NG67_PSEFL|nr:TIGR04255 family protein [Pseudomonas fluorescens]RON97143.1 hypothetical protein BK672_02280 [Pseudomonas fluorescens]